MKKYIVSVEKCNSYKNKEVKKALIENLKNLSFRFKPNLKVLIKPNLLGPYSLDKAITTHPTVIEELCKILKQHNATIYIGDSSGFDTNRALEICGINKLSKYAKILNFEGLEKRFFLINNLKIPLPKILFEVDLIINITKLKTHALTKVTLCTKNLYGCIPGKIKGDLHKKFPLEKDFSKLIYSLYEKIKPQLNIIDGVIGMEGEGPGTSGTPIKSNLILMSKNASAIDIIASEIIGFNAEEVYTNKFSNIKKKNIQTIGVKSIKLNFKKPKLHKINFLRPFVKIIPKPRIYFNKEKCTKCRICEEKCPMNAIYLNPYPVCNHKNCIRCLCCIEVCPNNAICIKESKIKALLIYIKNKIIKF